MSHEEPATAEDKTKDNPENDQNRRWEDDEIGDEVKNGVKEGDDNVEIAGTENILSYTGVKLNQNPTHPPRPGRKRSPYAGGK